MIQINFYPNGFTVSGHANSAPKGEDLVCAGVSSIVIGALNWFDHQQVDVTIQQNATIKCFFRENAPQEYFQWLKLLKIQLEALGQQKYLKINYHNEGEDHEN